jgi:tRNA 2-(methylsulfanyl)-N6-isopentenyladenosine37 hydroxylase
MSVSGTVRPLPGRSATADLQEIHGFLRAATPQRWFQQAAADVDTLLIDHAHCEKKAAGTALGLLYRYVDRPELLQTLSRLAREELRHFEQVLAVLRRRGIDYRALSPSRYAGTLMSRVRRQEPWRLVDTLLAGAIVEARSCERFAGLVNVLPADLATLYAGLQASEARHFQHYLRLAGRYAPAPFEAKLDELLTLDAELISTPDNALRFHSGPVRLSG